MEQLLQQIINGLSLGSIYALIALGYTMVYGIIKLINFAHGDVYMIGAYIAFYLTTSLNLSIVPAIVVSMLGCGLVGMLIEKIAYKPLRHSSRITVLITAIGVSLFLEYGMMFLVGPQPKSFPQAVNEQIFNLGAVQISYKQILIIFISLLLMLVLQFIVKNTKIGKAMRAVSTDTDAAQLMGINVNNTISFTFFVGSALAGAAGVLVGIYYNSIDPLMGMMPGLKAFVAAVFGGIGSIPGAMIGGLSIGLLETIVSGYGGSMFRDAVVFLLLILILILKPSGLLGKDMKEKV